LDSKSPGWRCDCLVADGDVIPPQEWLHVAVRPEHIVDDVVLVEAVEMPRQSCTRSAPNFPPEACIDLTGSRRTKTAIARIKPELFPRVERKTTGELYEYIATHRPTPEFEGEAVHAAHSEIRLTKVGSEYSDNIRNKKDFRREAERLLAIHMRPLPTQGLAATTSSPA